MILSAATLKKIRPLTPFIEEKKIIRGRSYGLSYAGYDIRIAQRMYLIQNKFKLASSLEKFIMPKNVIATVKDKSTWARLGLSVFNTVIEPGWEGYLTLELKNQGDTDLYIEAGDPIAQILFEFTDHDCEGYEGKYLNQGPDPVGAILE